MYSAWCNIRHCFPYFRSVGRHVVEDIPGIVKPVIQKYKDMTIHITEHIGASDTMADLILESASSLCSEAAKYSHAEVNRMRVWDIGPGYLN